MQQYSAVITLILSISLILNISTAFAADNVNRLHICPKEEAPTFKKSMSVKEQLVQECSPKENRTLYLINYLDNIKQRIQAKKEALESKQNLTSRESLILKITQRSEEEVVWQKTYIDAANKVFERETDKCSFPTRLKIQFLLQSLGDIISALVK